MNNSNEDTKRTYVPKTIGDSIQKINKKYSFDEIKKIKVKIN